MGLEVGQQREEDGERKLEDLGDGRHAVLGKRHTQVLLDGVDEHLVGFEDGPGVLQDGQQQLQRQHLRPQLVGPVWQGRRSVSKVKGQHRNETRATTRQMAET